MPRARLFTTVKPEILTALKLWADEEGRSLSNLCEHLLLEGLEQAQRPVEPVHGVNNGRRQLSIYDVLC